MKNPTASAGFEPAKLGTKGQHATSRPPKSLVHVCTSDVLLQENDHLSLSQSLVCFLVLVHLVKSCMSAVKIEGELCDIVCKRLSLRQEQNLYL